MGGFLFLGFAHLLTSPFHKTGDCGMWNHFSFLGMNSVLFSFEKIECDEKFAAFLQGWNVWKNEDEEVAAKWRKIEHRIETKGARVS